MPGICASMSRAKVPREPKGDHSIDRTGIRIMAIGFRVQGLGFGYLEVHG